MEAGHYTSEGKLPPSSYYNSLSGSACFPLPLLYNQMNSYPFFSGPFLPLHPCVLPQHGLQETPALSSPRNVLTSREMMKNAEIAMSPVTFDYVQARHRAYKEKHQSDIQRLNLRQTSLASILGVQNSNNCTSDVKKSEGDTNSDVYPNDRKSCDISDRIQQEGKLSLVGHSDGVSKSWNSGQSDSPNCPLCGVAIAPLQWQAHFRQEMEEFTKNTMWMCQKESMVELFNPTTTSLEHLRMHTLTEAGKRTVEARRETYLRVRANRLHRLGVFYAVGRTCRPRKATLTETSVKTKISHDAIKGQDDEETPVRVKSDGSAEVVMLGLTAQKDEDQIEEKIPAEQDQQMQCLISSESALNGDNPPVDDKSANESHETSHISSPTNGNCGDTEENRKNGSSVKCGICLESYRKPVVSVGCWHVHCERCWLKSLGTKRLCPQCDTITSPSDLRRIHL